MGKLIERRLLRLGEAALTLARVAAIAGVDFRIELAEAAIGQSAVQLASAWQELQDAQVLRDEAFAHDLVADAVLRGIPRWWRGVFTPSAPTGWPGMAANRPAWRGTGNWAATRCRAATAYADAAGRAAMASRLPEAAALYGMAAEQFAAAGNQERAFAASLSRLNTLINGPASEDVLCAMALALQAQATTELQRVQALRIEVDLLARRGHTEQAITKGLAAMALARSLGALQEQSWLATPLTGCLLLHDRAAEAQALLLPLQDWVEQRADTLERARYLGLRGSVLAQQGRLRESMQWRERGLALEREAGVTVLVATSLQHIAVAWGQMGRPERAEQAAAEALALCDAADRGGLREAVLRYTHARYLVDMGRYSGAGSPRGGAAAAAGHGGHLLGRGDRAAAGTGLAAPGPGGARTPRRPGRRRRIAPSPACAAPPVATGTGAAAGPGPAVGLARRGAGPGGQRPGRGARRAGGGAARPAAADSIDSSRPAGAPGPRRQERQGLELAALAWQADAAAAQGDGAAVLSAAQAAQALLGRRGVAPPRWNPPKCTRCCGAHCAPPARTCWRSTRCTPAWPGCGARRCPTCPRPVWSPSCTGTPCTAN